MKPVTLSTNAIKHLEEWKISDPKLLVKIISLIAETSIDPFKGTGKPEPPPFCKRPLAKHKMWIS